MTKLHASSDWSSALASLRLCLANAGSAQQQRKVRELPTGANPHDLAQTGWGIIYSEEEKARGALKCLSPLRDLRKQQTINKKNPEKNLYFEQVYPTRRGTDFLWRIHRESPGTIRPSILPYYLLLIGSPEQIPFQFQYDLAINRAVGRIFFEDISHYSRYAEALVATERPSRVARKKKVQLFLPTTLTDDDATRTMQKFLIEPLEANLPSRVPDWVVQRDAGRDQKSDLKELLKGGEQTPRVLLIAGHGKNLESTNAKKEKLQGALSCGGGESFAEADLGELGTDEAPLLGLIVGLFSCFGAGATAAEDFADGTDKRKVGASRDFLAKLPSALLARGALAVLGHVDRGWTASFRWLHDDKESPAASSLEDAVVRLLDGHRLGHALRPIYRRYSNIAAHLAPLLEAQIHKRGLNEKQVANQWTAFLDARNYIVLGDPAVSVDGMQRRHTINLDEHLDVDQALPVYLSGDLARRARSEAESRQLDLNEWVHQMLEESLRSTKVPDGAAAPSGATHRPPLMPIPCHLEALDNRGLSPELLQLGETNMLVRVGDPGAAKFRLEQLGETTWSVSNRQGEPLCPALPSAFAALSNLIRWAQCSLLIELSKHRAGPSPAMSIKTRDWLNPRPTALRWTEGEVILKEDTDLVIDIRNEGSGLIYFAVLRLDVSGAISWVYPTSGDGDSLNPGDSRRLEALRLRLPKSFPFHSPGQRPAGGRETLMAVGSNQKVAFEALREAPESQSAASQSSALGRILRALLHEKALPSPEDLQAPSWSIFARSFLIKSEEIGT